MKLLLANHHLVERAGSELYTFELATALHDAGHTVAVFTFVPGSISTALAQLGIGVFTASDRAAIEAFAPDLVHCHHAPCLYFLGSLELSCPVVHSRLGPWVSYELPPAVFGGVSLSLCVSEEVRDVAAETPFGREVQSHIFRNWFDERQTPRAPVRRAGELERLAVVSNHLDPKLRQSLDAIVARRPGFSWVHYGLPENPTALGAKELLELDAVITIGRTTLLAGALGVPCLIYDVYGCDGWLEAHRMPDLATKNFSGRLERRALSTDELEAELFERRRALELEATADACWQQWSLASRLPELSDLHARALQAGARLSAQTRGAYASLGAMVHDLEGVATAERMLRSQTAHRLDAEVKRLSAELGRLEAELQRTDAERAELRAEAELLRRALEAARHDHGALLEREARLAHDLAHLRGSAGVRFLEQVKRVPGVYGAWLSAKRLLDKQ